MAGVNEQAMGSLGRASFPLLHLKGTAKGKGQIKIR